jgi:V/A-type H+-transporting ATPase subunit E
MSGEIQHLIDQIQKEGLDEASKKADALLEQAKSEAEKIIFDAEALAKEKVETAEKEAEAYQERSIKAVHQSARDLLISLGQRCEKVIEKTLHQGIKDELKDDFLREVITQVVSQQPGNVTVSLQADQLEALSGVAAKLVSSSGEAVSLEAADGHLSGFTISSKEKALYLDYSAEAICDALCAYLRPELAKLVSEISRESSSNG